MNPWRKTILFAFIVLLPAVVVGISNLHVFPDSALSATIMLLVTVGVAAIFTWQSGNATERISRYCVVADIVICAILCVNLGGHWMLAREISAARQGVEERYAEEDREDRRLRDEAERRIALKKAEVEAVRADAERVKAAAIVINAERRRLVALPVSQRRLQSPVTAPTTQPTSAPSTETLTPPVSAGAADSAASPKSKPKLTPEQVRERWWWFLTALAFAECFASVLGGAILCGVWEWDRNIVAREDRTGETIGRAGNNQGGAEITAWEQTTEATDTGRQTDMEGASLQGGQSPGYEGVGILESDATQKGRERRGQSGGVGKGNGVGKGSRARKQSGYPQANKDGKLGGQVMGRQSTGNEKGGGRHAQVILLPSAHPPPGKGVGKVEVFENPAPDDVISGERLMDERDLNWFKRLLPASQGGWWEVDVKGRGLAPKFRWRDHGRQTLRFPQFTSQQVETLKESGYEVAARILRERIAANLYNFSLDPARRDKALAAAEKLGIDLAVHEVSTLTANGL